MKTKRLANLLLAVLMLAALSACATPNPTTALSTPVPTTAAADTATVAPTTAAAETSTAAPTTPAVTQLTTITAFILQQPYGLTDIKTNTFTTELEAITKVHLESDGTKEKMNLLLASVDYPELFKCRFSKIWHPRKNPNSVERFD